MWIIKKLIKFAIKRIVLYVLLIGVVILISNISYCKSIMSNISNGKFADTTNVSYSGSKNSLVTANVTRVVDGDTFRCRIKSKSGEYEVVVRLIGVDTPESVSPDTTKNMEEGKTASNYSKKILTDKIVKLEYDVSRTDKYGRHLCYVFMPDGTMYNEMLLKAGMAKIMTVPPNIKYIKNFTKVQFEARKNKKGFWNTIW